MSNNALCRMPQKPLAGMSALPLSLKLAKDSAITSPLRGSNEGSTEMSWHTYYSQFVANSAAHYVE